ncbi:MAG: zinc-ribbon domain-containing protein [Lachnospiraceae bacterium]|nr:zinc-ribbon domain-containing protein [Lachnospiraceae bacterium]
MFCESCGNNLPENAKFCNICGAEIELPKTEEAVAVETREVELCEAENEERVELVKESEPVKIKEAIKFISFIGIIVAAVGAFFTSITYQYGGKEISEKLFDYRISDVFLAGLLIMFLMLILRQSKLALTGFSLSIAAIYLYIFEFLQYRKDFVSGINTGLGAYLIIAGMAVSFIGLFIKFKKGQKLFK